MDSTKRRKYSPRFLAEICVKMPYFDDVDCLCVHREVFEDERKMREKMTNIFAKFNQEAVGSHLLRMYRLTRINK